MARKKTVSEMPVDCCGACKFWNRSPSEKEYFCFVEPAILIGQDDEHDPIWIRGAEGNEADPVCSKFVPRNLQ